MKKILLNTFFYALIVVIFFSGQLLFNSGMKTGVPEPIEQVTISGHRAEQVLGSGPAVIYFWAEWCGLCDLMQSAVSAFAKDKRVLTVAVKSGYPDKISRYMQQHDLDWPVIADPSAEIAERYGVKGVPAVFFINQNGEIGLANSGYTSETGLRVRLWLVDIFVRLNIFW